MRSIAAALFIAVSTAFSSTSNGWTHMARAGETLDQLSVRYYGKSNKSAVIRAANGFIHPDDGRIAAGEPVIIPEITFIRVQEGDSWESLSNYFLSTPRRAPFLAEMNDMSAEKMPPVGAIIKIPYHLRHIFAKGETIRTVAKLYYGGKRSVEWLRSYNSPEKRKYGRGEVIIVPLLDLVFSEEEQRNIAALRERRNTKADAVKQAEAREVIAKLKSDYEAGRYVRMVSSASKLLGYGRLTVPQEIGIYNYLAYAYVALGEHEMAVGAFLEALTRQPEMELSTITTSPKILKAFTEAKTAKELSKPSEGSGENAAKNSDEVKK